MLKTLRNLHVNQQKYLNGCVLDEHQKKVVDDFLQETVLENEFGTCVPIRYLSDILKSNELKNQMELGRGSSLSEKGRKEATVALFNCSKDIRDNEYPKYGFLMDKNVLKHILRDGNLVYQYGNVIFKFKKDSLLNRTTMTVGSSLDFQAYKTKCPMLVTRGNVCAVPFMLQKNFYNAIVDKRLLPNDVANISYVFDDFPFANYYELQYHGKVIISQDVEKVYFFPLGEDDEVVFNECIPMLEEMGIPWEKLGF